MRQPVWLRAETSYRRYVGGLRATLFAFAGTGVSVLLGASGVAGTWVPTIGVLAGFAVAFVAVPVSLIGWLRVPDKSRVNAHQGAFLRMVGRDLIKGIPSGEPGAGPSRR